MKTMKKTRISLLLLIALTISAIPLGIFIVNAVAETNATLPDYEPMELGPEFRNTNYPVKFDMPVQSALRTSAIPDEETIQYWLSLDSVNEYYFFTPFELRAYGDRAEVWVQLDLAFPEGDPRDTPVVTDEQVQYLLAEYEDQIIDTNEGYFGTPDFHDGDQSLLVDWGYFPSGYYEQPEGRKVILISNIRDESFYNSSYPAYIVGFYSSTFQGYFDRNIISIDCYAYEKRLGDEGTEWTPGVYVDRPNLYESTVAHEYQHLIHDDYHEASESWMNEACSLYAEPLNGYKLDAGQIEWFLATPDNSLTNWGDQGNINILADYGSSFLWALFLTSHYGDDFLGNYVQGGIAGIEGINLLLPEGVDFSDVFHDWRIANLIQTDSGPYGYTSFGFTFEGLDPLRVYEVKGKQFNWMTASEAFGETLGGTSTKYSTGIYEVSAYGSDYFVLDDLRGLNKFFFNGEDVEPFGWSLTDYGWYSGAADLYNALLYSAPYTVVEGDLLTINTYWDIEDYWDFAFVQVSTDDGETWTSIANEFTTSDHDPDAHPNIISNLPGLTSWSYFYFGDYDFHDISYDLSDYVGENVIFGFRYMTDWGTTYEGWYISQAKVGDTSLELIPMYPEIDFMVTVVKQYKHKWFEFTFEYDLWLHDSNEFGFTYLLGTKWLEAYVIVTPMMDIGYADYKFKSTNKIRHGNRCML